LVDLGLIHINRLIVHEVPRRLVGSAGASSKPVLSEVESPLEDDTRNFFQERLVGTLANAYEVVFDRDSPSQMPNLIQSLLSKDPADFVATSQQMAILLHASQGGVNPAGLLTLMEIEIGKRSGVAIVKLEKEEGARIRRAKIDGQSTFNLTHLRDLMLTKKTKVFKASLFVPATGGMEGLVCDTQKGQGTTVAFFFLSQFLGCKLKDVPQVTTQRFFDATERFINERVDGPEEKGRYQVALVAELQSSHPAITPETFATEHLEAEDRQPFLDTLHEEGLTARSYPKDLALVSSILKKVQWNFEDGISVVGRPEQVGEKIRVENRADGKTRMEIVDDLREVKGHR
jgi:hypothetical protein